MKQFCKIKFAAVIWFAFLLHRSIANPTNDQSGCYKIDKNGARFQFFCANAQELFGETCEGSTLSSALQRSSSSAVTELKISGCGVNGVNFALKELENVTEVDISYLNHGLAGATDWSHLDIPSNNKIIKLNISHNDLTEIPSAIINKSPNLKVIDLSHNKLTVWDMLYIDKITELVEIHLQHNRLHQLQGYFKNLAKLEYLDMRNNSMDNLNWIGLPSSFKTLHLENNAFKQFPCDNANSKQWMNTAKAYASWQNIEKLDLSCFKNQIELIPDSDEFVTFRNGTAEFHYNNQTFGNVKEIRSWFVQKAVVRKFVETVKSSLRSFEKLDLSYGNETEEFDFNDWSVMTNLKEISIQKSNLKRVKNSALLQSLNLTKFDADDNQIENAREIIEHLSPSIEELFLSGNSIGEVNADLFKNLTNLTWLQLSNTNLKIIDSSPFDQLKSLERLDISRNDLSEAKVPILSTTLEQLESFDATDCRIQNAGELIKSFRRLIGFVHLSGNFIGELTAEPFKGMWRMRSLYLSNTSLSIGDSNPFEPLEQLATLDISHNDLSNVNFTMLSPTLQKLEYFYAVGSKIKNAADVMNLLGRPLDRLDLSDNFIGKVQSTIFNDYPELANLKLRNTSLEIIGSEPISGPESLYHVDLSYNNFNGFNFSVLSPMLQELRTFKIGGCEIRNMDAVLEQIGDRMWELDLSNNPIEQLNFDPFKTYEGLETLHLSNANLVNFNFSALEQNEYFKFLNISFNHLNELSISSPMTKLEELDVHGNELREIHNFDRQHLPKLNSLGISGNHFDCGYLEQLKSEWPGLKFLNNEWNQKDKICSKTL